MAGATNRSPIAMSFQSCSAVTFTRWLYVFSPSAARSGWPRATRNMTLLPAA